MFGEYINLRDMFDGAGPGAAGDRFEGGGAISDIANALMRPAGYRARQERMEGAGKVTPKARPYSSVRAAPAPEPEAAVAPVASSRGGYVIQPEQLGFGMQPIQPDPMMQSIGRMGLGYR